MWAVNVVQLSQKCPQNRLMAPENSIGGTHDCSMNISQVIVGGGGGKRYSSKYRKSEIFL